MSAFAAYLGSQADWRRSRAAEYSDGTRDIQSAEALDSLVAFIEEDEDVQVETKYRSALESIEFHIDLGQVGIASPGPRTARKVSRYGFWDPLPGASASRWLHLDFIEELALAAVQDTYDLLRQFDHDVNWEQGYGLDTWEFDAAHSGVILGEWYWRRRDNWSESQQREAIEAARQDQADPITE
jgi:hypothetical protein